MKKRHTWLNTTKSGRLISYFQRNWWIKNLAIWLYKTHTWPHPPKSSSLRCHLPLMIISIQKLLRYWLNSYWKYWCSKNPTVWLHKMHTWPHPTKSSAAVSGATFPWWLSPLQKCKRSINSFQKNWWSKHPTIWLDKRQNWSHPTQSDSLMKC